MMRKNKNIYTEKILTIICIIFSLILLFTPIIKLGFFIYNENVMESALALKYDERIFERLLFSSEIDKIIDRKYKVSDLKNDFHSLTNFYNGKYITTISIQTDSVLSDTINISFLSHSLWNIVNEECWGINDFERSEFHILIWFNNEHLYRWYKYSINNEVESINLKEKIEHRY